MTNKLSTDEWQEKGRLLKQGMMNEQPPVQIEKVMEVLGYTSKASAEYALVKLAELGVVKWIGRKWYLV